MRDLVALRNRRHREGGFTLIELLIVIAIILIIIAIAAPQMGKIRMNAQEMRAASELRTINTAQQQYISQFGHYATSLAELGPPTGGNAAEGPSASGLIPAGLATGVSSGYNFTVNGTAGGYSVLAVPQTYNGTGRRSFFSDQSLTIHQNWGQEPATQQSAELK